MRIAAPLHSGFAPALCFGYLMDMDDHHPHLPGRHLLIDLLEAQHLSDAAALEAILRAAAKAAGVTVITTHFGVFSDQSGVTGMVLSAESHISIHTWPDIGFAALDIFMCGACNPQVALAHIETALAPARVAVTDIRRGADHRNP